MASSHWLIDAWLCPADRLDDPEGIRDAVSRAVAAADATVIDLCVHHFAPRGVTAVATLAESHLAVHTWPERGYFAADIFFCGSGDPERAIDLLVRHFQAGQTQVTRVSRGIAGNEADREAVPQPDAGSAPPAPRGGSAGGGAAFGGSGGQGPWVPGLHPAARFIAAIFAWIVVVFGLLRLPWVDANLLVPFARLQQRITGDLLGAPVTGVVVDASCSGADALALCVGVMLAFPATWRERWRGIALGFLLIIGLNSLRIGTLSAVVGEARVFDALHTLIWPAVIVVAVAAYVLYWMQSAARSSGRHAGLVAGRAPMRRFVLLASLFAALFFALAPWLLRSAALQLAADRAALLAGAILTQLGLTATVSGGLLSTARGAFVVTPECIATPLIPVYVAAILSSPLSAARRLGALLLAPLLFFALGTVRLLVLALPAALLPSAEVAIHAFSQVVVTVVLIMLAVAWLHRGSGARRGRATLLALAAFVAVGITLGPLWARLIGAGSASLQGWLQHSGHVHPDGQGALAMLPAFQLALVAALFVGLRDCVLRLHAAAALALLAAFQLGLLITLGEASAHLDMELHVSVIRALSIGVPVLLVVPLERGLHVAAGGGRIVAPVADAG